VCFLIPISGFGLPQSLLRYGALLNTKEEKDSLFVYVLKKGLLATVFLIFLIIVFSFLIPLNFPNTQTYIITLSFILIPTFIFEIIRAQLRLNHNNKTFAYTEITHSLLLLFSVLFLSYFFKETGYAIALLIPSLLTSLLFIKKLNIDFNKTITLPITDTDFWKYGFFASLSNVATQLLFSIDLIVIGYLLSNTELITSYRYISIVPFSLLFLPRAFITTDFVAFTEKIYDKQYIFNYIKSYMSFFFLVSVLLLIFCSLFANQIIAILDDSFLQYSSSFLILVFGVTGIFIFRGLFGNLLSSIGKAHVNYHIASFGLLINIVSNYYLIPKYGILGASITTASLMWMTGILSALIFWGYYRNYFLKN
jgi:O-antigen/teichoic acid export membrane protein